MCKGVSVCAKELVYVQWGYSICKEISVCAKGLVYVQRC